jgi:uncharacterized protein (DUF58 family)
VAQAVFPLVPRRRVIGVAFGGMRSARRGLGTDIASTRPYQPGDDMDSIDWAASARLSAARGTDEFIVREHYAEESPRVVVVADRRPTMAIGPPPRSRLRKPEALAHALELIAASAGAARSLLGSLDYADAEPSWRPPRSEHQHAPALAGRFRAPEDSVELALALLGRNQRDLPRGSFVFVVSDFLAPPGRRAWTSAVEHGWDVVPVVIQDPVWERSFPDVSGVVVPFADPATGVLREVRLTEREVAARRSANERRWAALLETFRSLGLQPVVLASSDPADVTTAFLRWADERIYVRGRA